MSNKALADIAFREALHPVASRSAERECDAWSETQKAAGRNDPTFSAFGRPKSAWGRSRPIGPMPATR
jgi:hypothetical protein